MFHVYAWAMGKYASAGLERVMACVLPCATLLAMFPVHWMSCLKWHRSIPLLLNLGLIYLVLAECFEKHQFPMKATWGPRR